MGAVLLAALRTPAEFLGNLLPRNRLPTQSLQQQFGPDLSTAAEHMSGELAKNPQILAAANTREGHIGSLLGHVPGDVDVGDSLRPVAALRGVGRAGVRR